jgi:hypothetical protein
MLMRSPPGSEWARELVESKTPQKSQLLNLMHHGKMCSGYFKYNAFLIAWERI